MDDEVLICGCGCLGADLGLQKGVLLGYEGFSCFLLDIYRTICIVRLLGGRNWAESKGQVGNGNATSVGTSFYLQLFLFTTHGLIGTMMRTVLLSSRQEVGDQECLGRLHPGSRGW